jgi:hypothetical protein
MTEFVYRMTFACPVAYMNEANDLFMWIGYSGAERSTFFIKDDVDGNNDPWEDELGNKYAIARGRFKAEFADRLQADLTAYPIPPWCYDDQGTLLIDTDAAMIAQEALTLTNPTPGPLSIDEILQQAEPTKLYVEVTR